MSNETTTPGTRGRVRRRVGAALVAAGVVFGGAMVLSRWWWFGYATGTRSVDIGDGTLYLASRERVPSGESTQSEFSVDRNTDWDMGPSRTVWGVWSWWRWGQVEDHWPYSERQWAFTVWPVAPLMVGIGLGLLGYPGLVGAVRRRRNCCARCGYSRAGLGEGALCPECGAGDLR